MIRDALPARPEARNMLLGTLLTSFGQGMTLPFLFIYLTAVRHIDPFTVGAVVALMGLLGLLLSAPAGTLIDRFGARRVILPMFVVNAIGIAGYGFAHTAWQALATSIVSAIGGSGLWAGYETILATLTAEAERQRVFGLSFAIMNLGIGAGGLVAGFIADVHHASSFRLLYLVDGATTLLPMLILLMMRSVGGPTPRSDEDKQGTTGGYREVFANRAFRRFSIFTVVLLAISYSQIEVGFPAFASRVAGVTPRTIAWAFAANTATIVLAQLFVLKRLDGRSRSRALALVGVIIAASWLTLGTAVWGTSLGMAVPATCVILCSAIFAVGETVMSPILSSVTNALATDELRGRYNSVWGMSWGVTAVVGPLTAAPLIGHGHGQIWLWLVVVGALIASAIALSIRPMLTPQQDGRDLASSPADLAEVIA